MAVSSEEPARRGTAALEKALAVLDLIGKADEAPDFAALSAASGLPRATLRRFLSALTAQGLIRFEQRDRSYRLGYHFLALARRSWERIDIRLAAEAEIRHLSEASGETVHLAMLHEDAVVYIDKVESAHAIRLYSAIGRHGPIHCTAVGKAMVAFLPDATRAALIGRLNFQRFTEHTICDPAAFALHLAEIRAVGFAMDREEHQLGVACVGAPVLDHRGLPAAGISVTAPTSRLDLAALERLAPAIVAASRAASRAIGGAA